MIYDADIIGPSSFSLSLSMPFIFSLFPYLFLIKSFWKSQLPSPNNHISLKNVVGGNTSDSFAVNASNKQALQKRSLQEQLPMQPPPALLLHLLKLLAHQEHHRHQWSQGHCCFCIERQVFSHNSWLGIYVLHPNPIRSAGCCENDSMTCKVVLEAKSSLEILDLQFPWILLLSIIFHWLCCVLSTTTEQSRELCWKD